MTTIKSSSSLLAAYRWHREHTATDVAYCASLALAEHDAKDLGLHVVWEDEAWDGEGDAPSIYVCASVYHPDRKENARPSDPHYYVLAHLGGVDLDTWRDSIVRTIDAELLREAIGTMRAEQDADDTERANELASRATYASAVAYSHHHHPGDR